MEGFNMPAEVNEALQQLLVTVILGVLSVISVTIVSYLNILKKKAVAYIQNIGDEKAKKSLEAAINKAHELVINIVTSLEQEEKQEILKAIEDGEVTRDELFKLKDIAIDKVIESLGAETVEVLNNAFGDTTEYIANLVSTKVYDLKAAQSITYSMECESSSEIQQSK